MSRLISLTFDIYCRVIDNYGDAGVCLRLARALHAQGCTVNLYCDRPEVVRTISCADDFGHGVELYTFEDEAFRNYTCQAVIAAFLCDVPEARQQQILSDDTLVISLDYLSAEKWVEDCHGLSSPARFRRCFYFYPGFTPRTGGLCLEPDFVRRVREYAGQSEEQPLPAVRQVTLFSYHNDALPVFLDLMQHSALPSVIKVFEGLALDNVARLYGRSLHTGDSFQDGKLTFECVPMCSQQEYDSLLLHSEFNFVRGEDSIVRAMLCGHPFMWHIYPQSEFTHLDKLKAMFERMEDAVKAAGSTPTLQRALQTMRLWHAIYNGDPAVKAEALTQNGAASFDACEQDLRLLCALWRSYLLHLPDLACSIIDFYQKKAGAGAEISGLRSDKISG